MNMIRKFGSKRSIAVSRNQGPLLLRSGKDYGALVEKWQVRTFQEMPRWFALC